MSDSGMLLAYRMTDRQRLAILNPCARGYETQQPMFWKAVEHKRLLLSTILTINKWLTFNSGVPVWHASVAVLDTVRRRPRQAAMLSSGEKKCVIEYAQELLNGVGRIPSLIEQHLVAIHFRKTLRPEEIARLPQEWCAIPAIDEGGSGKIIARDV